jgi:hypothetical protein
MRIHANPDPDCFYTGILGVMPNYLSFVCVFAIILGLLDRIRNADPDIGGHRMLMQCGSGSGFEILVVSRVFCWFVLKIYRLDPDRP